MKILFVDFREIDYSIGTPRREPLGGSQSALCYLAEALAGRGHDVALANRMSGPPRRERGVLCQGRNDLSAATLAGTDAVVTLNAVAPALIERLRPATGDRTRFYLWLQHDIDIPAVACLADPGQRDPWDGFVLVSDWQAKRYARAFGIPAGRITVLRNAIGPAFEDLFGTDPIATHKPWPPVLAYTSAPFRGLDRLVDAFPLIASRIPGTRLRVFSGMTLYHETGQDDVFRPLYDRCRAMAGIDYVGPVGQAGLAAEMREITCLAYPNTFPETSCIAVMEALAAGCLVVTSDLGALGETMGAFGRRTGPFADRDRHVAEFAVVVADELGGWHGAPDRESRLRDQVDRLNREATWRARAGEWETFLSSNARG